MCSRFVRKCSPFASALIILSLLLSLGDPPAAAQQPQAAPAPTFHSSSVMFVENAGQLAANAPNAEIATVLARPPKSRRAGFTRVR
jgi:hypothetical protein